MRAALPSLILLLFVLCMTPRATRAQAQSAPPGSSACGGSWETYTYPGEEFSVELPEMPALDHESRGVKGSSEKTETAREYGAYGGGIVYVLWAYDNPRHDEDINYFADYSFLSSGYAGRAVSLRAVRDLKLDGFAGRQFQPTADMSSGDVPVTSVYVYLTKKHAYAFKIVGADESHSCVRRFLNSFALSAHPSGRPVADETPGGVEPAGGAQAGGEADHSGVFRAKNVTHKAIIVTKPEPRYTEAARKAGIIGSVMIRMVLGANGEVSSITPVTQLPRGLTENAILAARHVKFIPAVKDGHYVSQYVAIVYNFNIY